MDDTFKLRLTTISLQFLHSAAKLSQNNHDHSTCIFVNYFDKSNIRPYLLILVHLTTDLMTIATGPLSYLSALLPACS